MNRAQGATNSTIHDECHDIQSILCIKNILIIVIVTLTPTT